MKLKAKSFDDDGCSSRICTQFYVMVYLFASIIRHSKSLRKEFEQSHCTHAPVRITCPVFETDPSVPMIHMARGQQEGGYLGSTIVLFHDNSSSRSCGNIQTLIDVLLKEIWS